MYLIKALVALKHTKKLRAKFQVAMAASGTEVDVNACADQLAGYAWTYDLVTKVCYYSVSVFKHVNMEAPHH